MGTDCGQETGRITEQGGDGPGRAPWRREGDMERRDFLKALAGVSVAAACPLGSRARAARCAPDRQAALKKGADQKVYLAGVKAGASDEELKVAVRQAALAATDFSWLSRGDTVFVKPAVNSSNPYPATTCPAALAAMVELLKDKGAGRVICGDMSGVEHVRFTREGISGSSRRLMESCGIAGAALAAGAELHFFEEQGWDAFHEEAPAEGSHWKHGLMMPDILREVQHIVLMPRCGSHVLAGSTLGMKAAVGYWRHDTRLEYHRDAATFHQKTAEGNTVESLRTKQRLVVTCGHKVLATFGPDEGYVMEPQNGLVIASESIVAHDMVSLAWLLENRRLMPDSEKGSFMDTSPFVAWIGNRMVVTWLGGLGQGILSDGFAKQPADSVWDDPVLARAYELFGGVPGVVLETANAAVDDGLKKRLEEMTALPS